MHLFHIPQCSIQNRNVHISVLNGALWDMEQLHSGICELGQICKYRTKVGSYFERTTGVCFINVLRALQNNLAKIYNARNHINGENFKLKLCTCA